MNHKLLLIQRTIALLIILTLIVGIIIFYWIDNYPKIEVRYIDRVITNEKVVTVKEYVSEVGKWEEFICTGYSANDGEQGTNNITVTGFNTECGLPIIAVDPDVIPLKSIVEIEGMGAYVSLDTGGAIKGNRIDILFDSKEDALKFGRQKLLVRIIK